MIHEGGWWLGGPLFEETPKWKLIAGKIISRKIDLCPLPWIPRGHKEIWGMKDCKATKMLIEIHQESDSSALSMKSCDLGNTNLDRTTNMVELLTRFEMIITNKHAGHLVRKNALGFLATGSVHPILKEATNKLGPIRYCMGSFYRITCAIPQKLCMSMYLCTLEFNMESDRAPSFRVKISGCCFGKAHSDRAWCQPSQASVSACSSLDMPRSVGCLGKPNWELPPMNYLIRWCWIGLPVLLARPMVTRDQTLLYNLQHPFSSHSLHKPRISACKNIMTALGSCRGMPPSKPMLRWACS